MTLLQVKELCKSYGPSVPVLRSVSLKVEQGEFLGLIGLSGAGKSTLLRCINRLVEPTSGEILFAQAIFGDQADGSWKDVLKLNQRELRLLRRRVGMIFQQFNIVKRLSVIDNVLSGGLGYQPPLKSCLGLFSREDRGRALANLDRVGLLDHAYKRADELSGGEQQRVAIARAVAKNPAVLLCDEPTGALDYETGKLVLEVIAKINAELGTTAMVITHNAAIAGMADRVLRLGNGRIVGEEKPARKLTPSEISW